MSRVIFKGTIEQDAEGSCVVWIDVVSPKNVRRAQGMSTGKNLKLARRLKAAIDAGVAFESKGLAKDDGGDTYLNGTLKVSGRRLNSDLTRLGF